MTFGSQVKYALIGTETSWGDGGTADKGVGILIDDVANPIEREIREAGSISSSETQKITTGIVSPGVTLAGDFQNGKLLEYTMGAVAHVTTGSDTVHTFTVPATAASAIIETGNNLDTDTVISTEGLLVQSATIGQSLNENLRLSVDFVGELPTNSTSASVSIISTLPVFPHALTTITINDTQATEVQNWEVTITKTVERSGGMSSNIYQQGSTTTVKFEFKATLGFQTNVFVQLFLGGNTPTPAADPASYDFVVASTNGTTLGSGLRDFNITLTNCQSPSFNETTTLGSLTFIDLVGTGTLSACTSTDDIASGDW